MITPRSLKWGDRPGLFRLALNVIASVLVRETQREVWREDGGQRWSGVAPGPADSTPEPLGGAQPCGHLHLSLENPLHTSDFEDCKRRIPGV